MYFEMGHGATASTKPLLPPPSLNIIVYLNTRLKQIIIKLKRYINELSNSEFLTQWYVGIFKSDPSNLALRLFNLLYYVYNYD